MALDASDPGYRPLLVGAATPERGAALIVSGEREIRIGDDSAEIGALLGLLDGTRSKAEIAEEAAISGADLDELLRTLAELGAVVDCAAAWRRFHRDSSLTSGLFRAIDQGELDHALGERWTPAATQRVALEPRGSVVREVAERRSSAVPGERDTPVTFEELSTILDAMYGRVASGRRVVPSAGGFYPLAIHALVPRRLGQLAPGIWFYDGDGALAQIGQEEAADAAAAFVAYDAHDPLVGSGDPVLIVSAEIERQARKYSNRAYRFSLMEAGAAMQMAYLAGTEIGVPVRAIGGVDETAAPALLGLPASVVPLLGITLGA